MFASGVVIVTASDGRELIAKTVSAFQTLSMEPPLVSVSIGRGSPLISLIRSADCFGISILRREQQDLSVKFSVPGQGRIPVDRAPASMAAAMTGAPIVDNCLGYFDCATDRIFEAGDHQIVVGRVVMADQAVGLPLLYFDGNYRGLAAYGSKA
jgi:flavin reductase (DIM6/NTAB) family NADH-FMN oxidoreductase RutF